VGAAGRDHEPHARIRAYREEGGFFKFRHTGASHIATRSRDGAHLLGVVRMMGDTSLATVNRHYFTLYDEPLQVIVRDWQTPDVDLFGTCSAPLTHRARSACS
jgi:hypothetical protein